MNILDSLRSLLTDELVSNTSSVIGEDGNAISTVMSGALPTVLVGLLNTDTKNYDALAILFGKAASNDNLMGDLLGGLVDKDSNINNQLRDSLVSKIFGEKANGIINILTNLGCLKNENSSKFILGIVGSLVASYCGKKMVHDNFNLSSILNLIGKDKEIIMSATPAGVAEVMVGDTSAAETSRTNNVNLTASNVEVEVQGVTQNRMKWIWPLLLLTALAIGSLYVLYSGGNEGSQDNDIENVVESEMNNNEDTSVMVDLIVEDSKGALDDEGNWVATKGDSMIIKLDNGIELFTTKGSMVNKLHQFISAPEAVADKTKAENWFNFEDVFFKTGSSNLKAGAETQLKNTVALLNVFPNVKVKLGGYTDNTGSEEANLKISKARAKTVYNKMIALGAQKTSFDEEPYEGYGPLHPTCAANDTDECKAKNRRIAIVVTQK